MRGPGNVLLGVLVVVATLVMVGTSAFGGLSLPGIPHAGTSHEARIGAAVSAPAIRVIATIPVASGPSAAAFDNGTGEVFVANEPSYNVSVITTGTNTVRTSVEVGSLPVAAAYDSAKGELFVANFGSSNVSVIADSNDTVVATVTVGSGANGVVYDAAKAEVFVTNYGSNDVSV
ncbi:MAG: hypothetical protein L3J80_02270, partial [Thermoplasmata archaeon]|nr:hypothetical protein [Thermoplasmata archaeon]